MVTDENGSPQASLIAMLTDMNKGKTMLQVDAALQEVLEAVKMAGGKGSLTLKFTRIHAATG